MVRKKQKTKCGALSIKALAIAAAVLWGGYLFLLGLFANLGIMWFSPELVELLATIYPGFAIGLSGAFIGLIYGMICGAICGAIAAWVHNFALKEVC